MKNFKYLFIIVAVIVLFASCSDDGDDGNVSAHPLVGSWDWQGDTATADAIIFNFKADLTGTEEWWENHDKEQIIMNNYDFTWSTDVNKLVIFHLESEGYDHFNYSIKDDTLTLNGIDAFSGVFIRREGN